MTFSLDTSSIQKNLAVLQHWMKENALDFFYISGNDVFLSEYVPRQEGHRYYFCGFTGSMAELLVAADGRAWIYVDGRYYTQAEKEILVKGVKIRKSGLNLREALGEDLKEFSKKSKTKLLLGLESDRTPWSWAQEWENWFSIKPVPSYVIGQLVNYQVYKVPPHKIVSLDQKMPGESALNKLKKISCASGEALFISALDQVAWATNLRGYQLPNASTFLAKALISEGKIILFVQEEFDLSQEAANNPYLIWVSLKGKDFKQEISRIQKELKLTQVILDPDGITLEDYNIFKEIFSSSKLLLRPGGLLKYLSRKSPGELEAIEKSFDLADQAIFGALKEIRERVSRGETVSELDLKECCEKHYKNQGALAQSFHTIAGFGENSAIIHYGKSSAQKMAQENEWMLLDSGGYFEFGFATDTTRTMLMNPLRPATARMKEIYTLVLKAYIHAASAVFKEGTLGATIDGLARFHLNARGLNYEHGTGHGVGIMVHEGGINFRPHSHFPLHPDQVISIEPGLYFPGEMGCRFENIVKVIRHPQYPGMLCFQALAYIGLDWDLVEPLLLTQEEKVFLEDYEKQCHHRGRSFQS